MVIMSYSCCLRFFFYHVSVRDKKVILNYYIYSEVGRMIISAFKTAAVLNFGVG